jgi:hypothetical protein
VAVNATRSFSWLPNYRIKLSRRDGRLVELVCLDGGRRTTQLMRDSLGGATTMLNRSLATFAVVIIALAGADLAQAWGVLSSHLFTQQLPDTTLFQVAVWVWLPLALLAVCCGLYGGYLAIRSADPANPYLTAFIVFYCIVVKVNSFELGFSAFRLAITLGFDSIHPGINFVGLALFAWLSTVRRNAERALRPPVSAPTINEQGAA